MDLCRSASHHLSLHLPADHDTVHKILHDLPPNSTRVSYDVSADMLVRAFELPPPTGHRPIWYKDNQETRLTLPRISSLPQEVQHSFKRGQR